MLMHGQAGSCRDSIQIELSDGIRTESKAIEETEFPKSEVEEKTKPTDLVFPCKSCIKLIMG